MAHGAFVAKYGHPARNYGFPVQWLSNPLADAQIRDHRPLEIGFRSMSLVEAVRKGHDLNYDRKVSAIDSECYLVAHLHGYGKSTR